MTTNTPEYDRAQRFLRKKEQKEGKVILLKLQADLQSLRKEAEKDQQKQHDNQEETAMLLKMQDDLEFLRKNVEQIMKFLAQVPSPFSPPNGSLHPPLPPLIPPLTPSAGPPLKPAGVSGLGKRLPDDWSLSEGDYEFCERLGLEVQEVFDSFCDFWRAKSGKDATKRDWPATWRNWCRKDASNKKVSKINGHSFPSPVTEHRPAYAALRDPTEIMADLIAKDHAKRVLT